MSTFQDLNLNCRDCRNPFIFTAGEQDFFAQKQFTAPTRCKDCRARRKAEQQNGATGSFAAAYAAPPPAPVAVEPEVEHRKPFGRRGGTTGRRPRPYGDDDSGY
jgi:hypothetical protein